MITSIQNKLKKNVCRIFATEDTGTGFLISNDLILTAQHVIADSSNIEVEFYEKEKKSVSLLIEDKNLDIAVLKLKESIDFYDEIPILDIKIEENSRWISRGFPSRNSGLGENILDSATNVVHEQHDLIERNDIRLDINKKLDTYEGFSGSPLVINDSIIGIIKYEKSQGGKARELKGLSIKYYKRILESLGVKIKINYNPSLLPLTITNNIQNYLDKHFEPTLENNNTLKVFAPKLSNKNQDIEGFVNELYESLHTFVGNRRDLSSTQPQKRYETLRKKFKENFSTNLLEELIGYNLLESDLNAPKIFTSLEQEVLKSSIHLYDCNDEKLFVRSIPILNQNIDDAIILIEKIADKSDLFNVDSSMIAEDFLRNSFNDEQKEYIEKLIIPSKVPKSFNIENAYGIFIGFDLFDVPNKNKMKNNEFKERYKETIIEMSNNIKERMETIILKNSAYYYFIYLMPFDSTENLVSISKGILSE